MIWQNELLQRLRSKSLIKCALYGAGIAFILMIVFLLVANGGTMNYGAWVFLPVTAVTVGGACGGVFYCLTDLLRNQGGWKKLLANIASILVYILSLYISLILALNVTGHWD